MDAVNPKADARRIVFEVLREAARGDDLVKARAARDELRRRQTVAIAPTMRLFEEARRRGLVPEETRYVRHPDGLRGLGGPGLEVWIVEGARWLFETRMAALRWGETLDYLHVLRACGAEVRTAVLP